MYVPVVTNPALLVGGRCCLPARGVRRRSSRPSLSPRFTLPRLLFPPPLQRIPCRCCCRMAPRSLRALKSRAGPWTSGCTETGRSREWHTFWPAHYQQCCPRSVVRSLQTAQVPRTSRFQATTSGCSRSYLRHSTAHCCLDGEIARAHPLTFCLSRLPLPLVGIMRADVDQ